MHVRWCGAFTNVNIDTTVWTRREDQTNTDQQPTVTVCSKRGLNTIIGHRAATAATRHLQLVLVLLHKAPGVVDYSAGVVVDREFQLGREAVLAEVLVVLVRLHVSFRPGKMQKKKKKTEVNRKMIISTPAIPTEKHQPASTPTSAEPSETPQHEKTRKKMTLCIRNNNTDTNSSIK